MNKLVLLSEVRREKTSSKNKLLELKKVNSAREQKDFNESYVTFKEKFDFFKNKECFTDLKGKKISQIKCEKRLIKIMERIFSCSNKVLLIQFINSIYNDELSINTRVKFIENKDIKEKNIGSEKNNKVINFKDSGYSVSLLADDEYKKFKYEIQFETTDDQNIAIMITKIDFDNDYRNIISLNKKKKEHENNNIVNLENDSKYNYNKYLIMFNSNIEVPDVYEFKSNFEDQTIDYKINIMKSWKYDFKQLFEKNMYILFPMKVLDLRKRLLSISKDVISKDLVRDEIIRFFKDMNRYLIKVKDKKLISDKDISELNLITIDLVNHFIKEKSNMFIDMKTDIEATLKDIVV